MKEFRDLSCNAPDAATRLLGCELERILPNGEVLRARIVETEAYDEADEGSHSFRGLTERTRVMFGPAGYAYVYIIYGMHCCLNVVTGPANRGEAVLIRAVEPLSGEMTMQSNRRGLTGPTVCNGPAKLCEAMAIDKTLNGHDLSQPPLQLVLQPPVPANNITQTTRIGLNKAADTPWRFYITDNPYVSRK